MAFCSPGTRFAIQKRGSDATKKNTRKWIGNCTGADGLEIEQNCYDKYYRLKKMKELS
jgi:hypothetical protein